MSCVRGCCPDQKTHYRSIQWAGQLPGPKVQEGKDADGKRFKATTDELNNTVTERAGDRQDVLIRAPRVAVQAKTLELKD